MKIKTCLIPAAGEGVRAMPQTAILPKGMLRVGGKPIIQHTIEMVRDQVGIENFVIVVGHLGQLILDYFKDGGWLNVDIKYVVNDSLGRGLSWSIYLGKKYVEGHFLVVLGDEFYQNSNHHLINDIFLNDTLAACGVIKTDDHEMVRQNYLVSCSGEHVVRLIEKPETISGNLMGTGTFILSSKILDIIGERYTCSDAAVDFIELLDEMCRNGHRIDAFELQAAYFNINDCDVLQRANRYRDNPGQSL